MSHVRRLKVRGFKSIEEIELPLAPLNVLIGPNGCGKSNIIGVFRFLDRLVSRKLQETVGAAGGAERFLFHGSKRTQRLKLYFEFGENAYEANLVPSPDGLILASEVGHYFGYKETRGVNDYVVQFGAGTSESKLDDEAARPHGRIARYIRDAVTDWVLFHFHDTSDSSPAKRTSDLEDNRSLQRDAGNLAAFLYRLKLQHSNCYRQIVEQVQLVAPFFDDFTLAPSLLNPNKIKLEWKQQRSDAYFDAHSLSDGTLRFICLATLLLQPKPPSLILIDEPELGLHPYAIQLIADLLKAASKRSQVLLATQSVTLLNQLEPEHLIVAEHDGERTTAQRLSEKLPGDKLQEWLHDYAIGELWEKNVIGGRPR